MKNVLYIDGFMPEEENWIKKFLTRYFKVEPCARVDSADNTLYLAIEKKEYVMPSAVIRESRYLNAYIFATENQLFSDADEMRLFFKVFFLECNEKLSDVDCWSLYSIAYRVIMKDKELRCLEGDIHYQLKERYEHVFRISDILG